MAFFPGKWSCRRYLTMFGWSSSRRIRNSEMMWFFSWLFMDVYSISFLTSMFPLSFWRTLRTVPNDPFPITSNGSYSSSMEPILEQSDSNAASLSCDWLHVWRCSLHFPDLRCLYLGEYFEIDRMRQLTVASSAYRYMCLVRWLHIQGLAEYFINDLEVSLDIITWFLLLHIRVGILSRVRFFSQFWKFVWSKARNRVFIQHEQSLSSNKVEVPMLKFQFLRNMKKNPENKL